MQNNNAKNNRKKSGVVNNRWIEYEEEKLKIYRKAETQEEYDKLINELVDRLGI